jgi:hypothetical protein
MGAQDGRVDHCIFVSATVRLDAYPGLTFTGRQRGVHGDVALDAEDLFARVEPLSPALLVFVTLCVTTRQEVGHAVAFSFGLDLANGFYKACSVTQNPSGLGPLHLAK